MVSTGRAYKSSLDAFTASLLAVLLFCGTALAGVCPLRCELWRDASTMRQTAGDQAMAMPMGHCHGMAMEPVQGDMASAVCPASMCGHAVVSAAVAGERDVFALGVPEAALAQVVLMPPQVRVAALAVERPPRSMVGFDPVLVALRV